MEVLFTLLAHRYERHSVLLTSNLVFSEWERIFKRSDDHRGGRRSTGASQRHPGDESTELSHGER